MKTKHFALAALLGLSSATALAKNEEGAAAAVDKLQQQHAAATNGLSINGLGLNGLSVNGLKLDNGLMLRNGLEANGLHLNGLSINGFRKNGLHVNGLHLNGFRKNGLPGERLATAGPHVDAAPDAFGGLRLLASTPLAK